MFPNHLNCYIQNCFWNFPVDVLLQFHVLKMLADQVIIPRKAIRDKLIWKHNTNGILSER